jgi:Ala-tRNA(Pro) deacylase
MSAADEDGATSAAVLTKLRESNTTFELLKHEPTRTSQESCDLRVAAGWKKTTIGMGAKAIVIKSKGKYNLIVMSAAGALDKKKVCKAIPGVKSLSFASEEDVFEITGCRSGAVPPFGSCFRTALTTYVDAGLEKAGGGTINFNCGLRTLSLQMSFAAFVHAEKPTLVEVAS